MTNGTVPCSVCGGGPVRIVPGYPDLPRVSSDCRPVAAGGSLGVCTACGAVAKPVDDALIRDITAIYAAYDVYFQGGGVEQIVFDAPSGTGRRRSEVLCARLRDTGLLPARARAIDVGCGNGGFLRALSATFPGWALYGNELDGRHRETMRTIPGFAGLIEGGVEALDGTFELISLIHALEHFTTPFEDLVRLRRHLAPGGHLFVQIPNLDENPFDLVIADHVSHLEPRSIARLFARAGYEIRSLATDWVQKEMSILARPAVPADAATLARMPAGIGAERLDGHLRWLDGVLADARRAMDGDRPVGLFGTSIAATWLAADLGDRVAFHVDEDPHRQGRLFAGKPVLAPEAVPAGAVVVVLLAPVIAHIIGDKLARMGIEAVLPPEVDPA